jgi:hypothetical protein
VTLEPIFFEKGAALPPARQAEFTDMFDAFSLQVGWPASRRSSERPTYRWRMRSRISRAGPGTP